MTADMDFLKGIVTGLVAGMVMDLLVLYRALRALREKERRRADDRASAWKGRPS